MENHNQYKTFVKLSEQERITCGGLQLREKKLMSFFKEVQNYLKDLPDEKFEEHYMLLKNAFEKLRNPKKKQITVVSPYSVGNLSEGKKRKVLWDCVWFGRYPQRIVRSFEKAYDFLQKTTEWNAADEVFFENKRFRRVKNEAGYHYFLYEPILWRVLKTENGEVFLLADDILDVQKFHEADEKITWENSDLRNWLNQTFLNIAFSQEEKENLLQSEIINEQNKEYKTNGGKSTRDRVFLLSISEVDGNGNGAQYGFLESGERWSAFRKCKFGDYVKEKIPRQYKKKNGYTWWLRSMGGDNRHAAVVVNSGWVSNYGDFVHCLYYGVRPAIKVQSSLFDCYVYGGKAEVEEE